MIDKNKEHFFWNERYRPQNLDDYVGNEALIQSVKIWIESGEIPNLLLYGKAGTGKCLDYSEYIDIEMEVSDDEYKILKQYEI